MYMKLILVGALLTLSSPLFAAEQQKPIAELYGEKITVDMLGLPREWVEEQRKTMSEAQFEKWLAEGRKSQLAYGIMQEAQKHLLKELNQEPTDQEIDSYLAFMKRTDRKMQKENQQQIRKLEQALADPKLDPKKKSEMESTISFLREAGSRPEKKKTDEERRVDRAVAEQMVRQWKFYRTLYHKYGGRVVAQQVGYEPVDAIKAFIEEMKKNGDYRILDPAYEGVFQETFDYVASPNHDFVDKAEADKYFAAPWWVGE